MLLRLQPVVDLRVGRGRGSRAPRRTALLGVELRIPGRRALGSSSEQIVTLMRGACEVAIGQRRAAVGAEAALGDGGALRRVLGAPRVNTSASRVIGGKGAEGRAARLLAHAAMADADAVRRRVEPVAHRAALAAAGQILPCGPPSVVMAGLSRPSTRQCRRRSWRGAARPGRLKRLRRQRHQRLGAAR